MTTRRAVNVLFAKASIPGLLLTTMLASCAYFPGAQEIAVSAVPPNSISIQNNAALSTLRGLTIDIVRDGNVVHTIVYEGAIPAGMHDEYILSDFVMQSEDTLQARNTVFSHDM
jgi:hypothetical protein